MKPRIRKVQRSTRGSIFLILPKDGPFEHGDFVFVVEGPEPDTILLRKVR